MISAVCWIIQTHRQTQLYMDPLLRRGGGAYHDVVKDLRRRGLVRFSRRPTGHVIVFFVTKKSGQLRMIVDARHVNKMFKSTPSVSMTSPDVLSSLECEPTDLFVSSTVDIKDYFHRLKLSEELSDIFCKGFWCGSYRWGGGGHRGGALASMCMLANGI